MNRRLSLMAVLALLLAALIWTNWEDRQAHKQIATLTAQLEVANQKLDRFQKEATQRHDRQVAAAKKREETKQAKAAAPAAKPNEDSGRPFDLTPYMEKEPGYADLRTMRQRQQVNRIYGDLKGMNLPPDQLDKLRSLLAERMQAPQEAREVAIQAGIAPNSPEMAKAVQAAMDGVNADIKALVGPDQAGALSKLQAQSGFRSTVEYSIAPDMNAAGLPLTNDQVNALAQAQQDAQKAAMESSRRGGGGTDYQKIMYQAMADQAAKILSPDQLPVFQQSITINQQMAEVQGKAMAAAQAAVGHRITSWTVHGP